MMATTQSESTSAMGESADQKRVNDAVAMAQSTEEDYIANTFSKFGLNINFLMGDATANDQVMASDDTSKALVSDFGSMVNQKGGSKKLEKLLDAIPDFTALTEPTVSMGQLFA